MGIMGIFPTMATLNPNNAKALDHQRYQGLAARVWKWSLQAIRCSRPEGGEGLT